MNFFKTLKSAKEFYNNSMEVYSSIQDHITGKSDAQLVCLTFNQQ